MPKPTIRRQKFFLTQGQIWNLQYLTHLRSDSGADGTHHAQDRTRRAHTGIGIEILKNTMFGHAEFSVYVFTRSWVEVDHRQKECSKYVGCLQSLDWTGGWDWW